MVGRAGIVALAALTATAALAIAPSAGASLWPPQTVTMTITSGDRASPANVAVWPGVRVVVAIRNHSHAFHTFTIPALRVGALILPARGAAPQVTRVTFTAPRHGVVTWLCVICPSGIHGLEHAMTGKVYAMVP